MFILGRYYADGIGVEKDEDQAQAWFAKAAAAGNATAKALLAKDKPQEKKKE